MSTRSRLLLILLFFIFIFCSSSSYFFTPGRRACDAGLEALNPTRGGADDTASIRRIVKANEAADDAYENAGALAAKAKALTSGVVDRKLSTIIAAVDRTEIVSDLAVTSSATGTEPTTVDSSFSAASNRATSTTESEAAHTQAQAQAQAQALPPDVAAIEHEAERQRAIAAAQYAAVLRERLLAETHVWYWNASTRLAALLTRSLRHGAIWRLRV